MQRVFEVVKAHHLKATEFIEQRNFESALNEYNQALTLSNDLSIYFARALLFYSWRKFESAKKDFIHIRLSLDYAAFISRITDKKIPIENMLLEFLGMTLFYLDHANDGWSYFEELAVKGEIIGNIGRGLCLLDFKERHKRRCPQVKIYPEKIFDDFNLALNTADKSFHPTVYNYRARCYVLMEQYAEALADYVSCAYAFKINNPLPIQAHINDEYLDNFKQVLLKLSEKNTNAKYNLSSIRRGELFRAIQQLPSSDQTLIFNACLDDETALGARFLDDHFYDTESYENIIQAELSKLDPTIKLKEKKKPRFLSDFLSLFKQKTGVTVVSTATVQKDEVRPS